MAKYTIELSQCLMQLYLNKKYTKEQQYNLQYDYSKIYETTNPVEIVAETREDFFDFNYPLYDPTHKAELERKILYHYWDYEIGVETYAKFKFNVNKTLNEIMPYYNKIYKAVANDFDFDINIDFEEKIKGNATTTSNNSSTNNLESETEDLQHDSYTDRLRESDTPQNDLQNVENGKYISKYNYNNGNTESDKTNTLSSTNNTETESIGTSDNKTTRNIVGTNTKTSKAEMLKQYISAIQNVDMQVIEALKSCFMLLC